MAYSNGRIYIDRTVTPNIGVSIYDIQRALGESSADLGTLCRSNNINMWALYKPQVHQSLAPIHFSDRMGVHTGEWDFLLGEHFGIDIPYHTGDRDSTRDQEDAGYIRFDRTCEGILHNDIDGFVYHKPYNVPYRLSDFARPHFGQYDDDVPDYMDYAELQGYNHNSKPPFTAELDISEVSQSGNGYWWSSEHCWSFNPRALNEVRFIFRNEVGSDFKMQNFINLNMGEGDIKWRPYIQLYGSDGYASDLNHTLLDAAGDSITEVDEQGHTINTFILRIPMERMSKYIDEMHQEYPLGTHIFYGYLGIACCDGGVYAKNYYVEGQEMNPKLRRMLYRNVGVGTYALFPIPPLLGNSSPFKVKFAVI